MTPEEAKNLKIGTPVRILPHTRYYDLSKGAVVTPVNEGRAGTSPAASHDSPPLSEVE